MNNTSLIIMTSCALIAIGALLTLNLAPKIASQVSITAIPPLQAKTAMVYEKGIPYTLNYDQLRILTNTIQKAESVDKKDYPEVKGPFNFEKIVITRFNGPDLEIIPIQYKETNLVFSVPALDKDTYYIELSGGALQSMLKSVHP